MKNSRLYFIDNIRWAIIILVVIIHLNVTYGNLGSWYYVEVKDLDVIQKSIFTLIGAFTQSYFMGLMFFIAGYFVLPALERKGIKKFISDRFLKLIIPALIFMLILQPIIIYIILPFIKSESINNFGQNFSNYIVTLDFLGGNGPLWFTIALFIFSVIFVILTKFLKLNWNQLPDFHPTNKFLITLMLVVSFITFLVRQFAPMGTSFYNFQFCYFTQYIVSFYLGIKAYQSNFLNSLDYKLGKKWFITSIIGGLISLFIIGILGRAFEGNDKAFNGGLTWQTMAFALWESFIWIGFSLGIIVLFRKYLDYQNNLTKFLSTNSFAVYFIHAPIIILVSFILIDLDVIPILKFFIAILISIPTVYLIAWSVKKVRIMDIILT